MIAFKFFKNLFPFNWLFEEQFIKVWMRSLQGNYYYKEEKYSPYFKARRRTGKIKALVSSFDDPMNNSRLNPLTWLPKLFLMEKICAEY